jgi:ubiquinone/menaquinone biosynthesis C-methylase UbiE
MDRGFCPVHPDAELLPALRGRDHAWGFPGVFSFGACAECRTLVLDPRPSPAEMGPFYARYYEPAMLEVYREMYRNLRPELAGFLDRWRAASCSLDQARVGPAFAPGQRVLDVGCGLGGFLRFLRERTRVDVLGIDFDPTCRAMARELHGVEVDSGELAAQGYSDASFDVVTSYQCLEHVYDPRALLREMARVTRPGGTLHIDVPTPDWLAALFGGRWGFLQPPTHLFLYRAAPLRALVEEAGFEVLRVRCPWSPGELSLSLIALCGFHRVLPALVLPLRTPADLAIRALLFATLPLDLWVTFALARGGHSGVMRVLARRRGR